MDGQTLRQALRLQMDGKALTLQMDGQTPGQALRLQVDGQTLRLVYRWMDRH